MPTAATLDNGPHAADDLALKYFIWARRRDRSIWRRLVLENASQAAAGVEHFKSTACAFTGLLSQYEQESQDVVTTTLSARERTTFYDSPAPRPPRPHNFQNRSEHFPIRDSIKVMTCEGCKGSGRKCGKRGCTETGSDHAEHVECEGTGQLATWQVVHFDYRCVDRTRSVYPMEVPKRVQWAYQRWLGRNAREIDTFTLVDARKQIPRLTEEGEQVVDRAAKTERELRAESTRGPGRELFVKPRRYLTPFAYGVSRLNGRGDRHFVIGDRDVEHVAPFPRPDIAKVCAWLCLATTVFLAQATAALAGIDLASAPAFWVSLHSSTGFWGPSVIILLAVLGSIPGFLRMRERLQQPTAVLVLPDDGRRSQYVTLFGNLGSFCGALTVLDTDADSQTSALMKGTLPTTDSELLTMEHTVYGQLRLFEVPHHGSIGDEELRTLIQSSDLVLIPGRSPDSTKHVEERIGRLSRGMPCVRLSSNSFDDARKTFLAGRYSTEDVRRGFLGLLQPLVPHLRRADRNLT